ncbi:MAG TPA: choice-of-anchor D domain-containing protein [Candidatus Kapabacteria bacterium]|nr:choice-of-anchor D domain-containing protein [Candidatus Kapabacteria bacterium]
MIKRIIIIWVIILFAFSGAAAQWQRILNVPGSPVYSIYFFDDLSGFPHLGFAGVGMHIWRTGDGGKTWIQAGGVEDVGCQFAFKDSLTGWCASRAGYLFKTIDGGWSWTALTNALITNRTCEGVYYNSAIKRLFFASWSGTCGYSDDDGMTWMPITDDPLHANSGIDFTSGNDGMITSYEFNRVGTFLITHDGGSTWSRLSFGQECWQILAIKGSNTYFAACEGQGKGVNRTDDGGVTWNHPSINGFSDGIYAGIIGDIHGDLCGLYIQTYYDGNSFNPKNWYGIYRSFNEGKHWESIEGPSLTFWDHRFFTLGKHIFAGDTSGGVWYLYDTIPPHLFGNVLLDSSLISFDTISDCSDHSTILHFQNTVSCYPVSLSKVQWGSSSGTNPFTFLPATSLPHSIATNGSDSIEVKFPNTGGGNFNKKLQLTFTVDGHSYDTIVTVTGFRPTPLQAVLSNYTIHFDTIPTCTGKELITTITNTGCDTEAITLLKSPSSEFTIIAPTSLVTLIPGDSVQIRIQIFSKQKGQYSSSVEFQVTPKKFPSLSFLINLDGYVDSRISTPQIYPVTLNFDSVSVCDSSTKQLLITLTNRSACDSLRFDSLWLGGETMLFSTTNSSPLNIAPSDSSKLIILFKAGSIGIHKATIHVRFNDGVTERDTTIPLQAFVYAGKGVLASNESAFDFGPTTFCDGEHDTVITLRNTGCDTLIISSSDWQGSGFSLNGVSFPLKIAPGDSTQLHINSLLDTIGGKLQNIGKLSFTSDADNTLTPIIFTRSYQLPSQYSFHLSPNSPLNGTSGDKVQFNVMSGQLSLPSVKTIDFDITLNSDLLTYSSFTGPNTVTNAGNHFHISGNPFIQVPPDSIIVQLNYTVYLTKDSTTNILLQNVHLNNDDSSFEKCHATAILSNNNSTFDYMFRCGERLLQNGIASRYIRIASIHPNPANDEIEIVLYSEALQTVSIGIFNTLGEQVMALMEEISPGENSIKFNMRSIASGLYIIRASGASGEVSQSFVKEQ